MAESNGSSFQNLGNGAYRVSGAAVSPTTGRYVTRSSQTGRTTSSGSPASSTSKSTKK